MCKLRVVQSQTPNVKVGATFAMTAQGMRYPKGANYSLGRMTITADEKTPGDIQILDTFGDTGEIFEIRYDAGLFLAYDKKKMYHARCEYPPSTELKLVLGRIYTLEAYAFEVQEMKTYLKLRFLDLELSGSKHFLGRIKEEYEDPVMLLDPPEDRFEFTFGKSARSATFALKNSKHEIEATIQNRSNEWYLKGNGQNSLGCVLKLAKDIESGGGKSDPLVLSSGMRLFIGNIECEVTVQGPV
jgi:hypothetical protein